MEGHIGSIQIFFFGAHRHRINYSFQSIVSILNFDELKNTVNYFVSRNTLLNKPGFKVRNGTQNKPFA
jgi:hypothetical protein